MIVFSYPDAENIETMYSLCPEGEVGARVRSFLEEITEESDADIAVCFFHNTFLVRRFYEEYEFSYPLLLDEEGDALDALSAIEEYCRRYELPLIYSDLTREECEALSRRYRLCRSEEFNLADEGEEAFFIYRLTVVSPLDMLDTFPQMSDGVVTVNALLPEDIPSYATLCRDEEILALWGFDYRDVDPDMTDADFYEGALDEFSRGISLTLAVRAYGRFVGEVALYAFDGRGGCECSVRILRGYRRLTYARRALLLLFAYAREELALSYMDGICLTENDPSKALMASLMEFVGEKDGTAVFRKYL